MGGRDLVLDLTDLLFQAEAPLLCGILIPYYITFHLAIRQTTATPSPSDQVSCCGHVRQTVHMNTNMQHVSVMGSYSETHILHIIISIIIIIIVAVVAQRLLKRPQMHKKQADCFL